MKKEDKLKSFRETLRKKEKALRNILAYHVDLQTQLDFFEGKYNCLPHRQMTLETLKQRIANHKRELTLHLKKSGILPLGGPLTECHKNHRTGIIIQMPSKENVREHWSSYCVRSK